MSMLIPKNETATLIKSLPSAIYSSTIYQKLAGKPLSEIIKAQFIDVDCEQEELNLNYLLRLGYIDNDKKMICACMHEEIFYLHDLSGLTPETTIFADIELKQYCHNNAIAIFNLNSEIIIAASNYELVEKLQGINEESQTIIDDPLLSFIQSCTFSTFHLIGSTKQQCIKAMTQKKIKLTSTVTLEGIYAPLNLLLHEIEENNSFSVQAELNSKTNEILQLSTFKHEKLFTESKCQKDTSLGLALKTLSNLYYSLNENQMDNTTSLIHFSGKHSTLKCKISQYNTNNDNKIIMLSFIRFMDDSLSLPTFHYTLTTPIKDLLIQAKIKFKDGESVVLCLPKKYCLQIASTVLIVEAINLYKQGGFAFAINTDAFDYQGKSFSPVNKKVLSALTTLEDLIVNAVIYGPLKTANDISNAEILLENLHNVIAVTYANKEHLPPHLKRCAIQIK
ncbi:hypothetical protein PVK62_08000 [Aliivibrio sp. S3MY1]|uniref:hypothetical protein n=1 Tax=unclassified Aliivibrio TaxID=2645654 RepID=UPI0023782007|nr:MULTISPECIES: hypothetical protein [unclassified Aliivibrio]MDD9176008.1 hypothetical protein [Aliivibrio sp. S3TY1]MDD9193077.1 hypothetical protein [Aliivibrio sp. S2TY2]MDD9195781.1 hypothetical protein [Aliivibrio sp. S3MY1]